MRRLKDYAELVNRRLDELIPDKTEGEFIDGDIPWLLNSAMRYSLLVGGKRLRPSMMLYVYELLGGRSEDLLTFACAVEMIHTYSLIHDDLPGMDNDTLRRGKPTNHVVYGVGQAILAGDGLLNNAFETLLSASLESGIDAGLCLKAVYEIALGAGARGMVGGQCMDLYCENNRVADADALNYIHINKTTRMFMHPLKAVCILANATQEQTESVVKFARAYGLLFQITDDILDVTGDQNVLGKSIGKDSESGKLTGVSAYGLEGARERAEALTLEAVAALDIFGDNAIELKELALNALSRTY